jgi:hypothetical protein
MESLKFAAENEGGTPDPPHMHILVCDAEICFVRRAGYMVPRADLFELGPEFLKRPEGIPAFVLCPVRKSRFFPIGPVKIILGRRIGRTGFNYEHLKSVA